MIAEKLPVVAPAATVTEAGTVTEVLLLLRLTVKPPVGAAVFSETVQASEPAPVMEAFVQVSPVSTGTPVPLRLMAAVPLVVELLAMVKVPLAAPAAVGANCTVSVAAWFGFRVSGKLAPETERPVPVSVAELTTTAAVPVEDSVIDCVVDEFTDTLPKLRLEELMVSVGTAAFNCSAKVWATLPALAESVTACMVLTEEAVAEKPVLVAPAATVTEPGTVTEVLLLARLTIKPPLGAAVFSETVQESVAAPVTDALAQVRLVTTGTPAPLRLMAAVPLVVELLTIVKVPLVAPAAVGVNCTVSVAVWLGSRVRGKLAPETEKPVPVSVAALMVTVAVPVEDSVIDCVVDEFTDTLPKLRFEELMVSVGTAAFSCSANV